MLERRGQEIQKPTDSIRNLSRVISHFTDYLTRENILKGKIAKNEIEEKIKKTLLNVGNIFLIIKFH